MLESLPVNATLIFYDGTRKYHSGTMPYLAIKKEFNNALQGVAYREHDNRRQIFGQPIPEANIDKLVTAIHHQSNPSVGASFLNTYVLQYSKSEAARQSPSAIAPDEKPDMDNLKRVRQIKIAKAKKHLPKK